MVERRLRVRGYLRYDVCRGGWAGTRQRCVLGETQGKAVGLVNCFLNE